MGTRSSSSAHRGGPRSPNHHTHLQGPHLRLAKGPAVAGPDPPCYPVHAPLPGAPRLQQALKLYKLRDAVECAQQLRQPDVWRTVALTALDVLEVDVAIAAYRQAGAAAGREGMRGLRGGAGWGGGAGR